MRAMFEAEFTREMALGKWRGGLAEVRGAGHREAGNFYSPQISVAPAQAGAQLFRGLSKL